VDIATAEAFSLDPETAHRNHGAFGVAPSRCGTRFYRYQRRNDQELPWED
jgi:hypothetical protein